MLFKDMYLSSENCGRALYRTRLLIKIITHSIIKLVIVYCQPNLGSRKPLNRFDGFFTVPTYFVVICEDGLHSGPENVEKSRPKKLVKSNKSKNFFREIEFFGSF